MCGIVGIWDYKNKIDKDLLTKMRDTMRYRGPDDAGLFINPDFHIGFGHRRLSIIDLSQGGHQPMKDKNLVIVFNGEIYNFKEIREELKLKNYNFSTHSDTEVILKAYREWQIGAVDKFRGMFAFAIWDEERKKLILVRDRAGVKPLYYYNDGNLFIFASEIKAIIAHPQVKKELNYNALAAFLQFGYIPAPLSIFKNIHKIKAGHYLVLDDKKNIKEEKYWDILDFYLKKPYKTSDYSEKEIEQEMEKRLIESFRLRMVADVPVGVFLSGGLDSSLVTALLQKEAKIPLKTFTIGFHEEKYNEAQYAKEIANYLKTDHYELYCTPQEALEIVPKLPEIYDEPFADSSSIPTYLVSRFAKQKVKVALSADAGDELFCGYDRYRKMNKIFNEVNSFPSFLFLLGKGLVDAIPSRMLEKISKAPNLKHKLNKAGRFIKSKNDLSQMYLTLNSYWFPEEIRSLILAGISNDYFQGTFFKDFKETESLELMARLQEIDFKTYLPDDILTKVDRASMANSLEARTPFLDPRIMEFIASLPLSFKYRDGKTKYILRKILYRYIPEKLLDRPKHGFGIPIDSWLRNDLKNLLLDYLSPERISREGIFNPKIIEKELKSFLNGNIYAARVWNILVFEMWKEKWME